MTEIKAPSWSSGHGEDDHGTWTDLEIEGARQRLRFIPPGTFWRGSPEEEAGRYPREGPRHEVTLTRGFWLGSTPCTQALWTAVMGNNPSAFPDPQRPVEQVSWEDCLDFFEALEGRASGLQGRLPTEAEWEYACRAGTTASTYAGELEILGLCHAPLLDEIAWYGGNCSLDFDHPSGGDISALREKHHEGEKGGTHPVARKAANPWGLYDMLGNVLEWCEDGYDLYPTESQTDPLVPMAMQCVVRGGAWNDLARLQRAAYRSKWMIGLGNFGLGFRLAISY